MAASVLVCDRRTTWVVALVAVTVIASTTTAIAGPAHRSRLRVGRPCSGRLEDSVDVPAINDVEVSVSRHDVQRSMRRVTRLLDRLRDDVHRLKTDYEANRDVVHIGMHVDAMPRYTDVGLHIPTPFFQTVDLASTVANATLKLSRVAVFVHLLRLEETRHEPRPFEDALAMIEDHAEHGLYGILCHLHVVHRVAAALDGSAAAGDVQLAAGVDAALADVRLMEASRPAHRHVRAISIITDFALLLDRLVLVLDEQTHLFNH